MDHTLVLKYFPYLEADQVQKFATLFELYSEWNQKINVISRKDIDNFYLHHVLHSLSIAKVVSFKAFTEVLDAGTGGGFPGIPLAILLPKVHFHLVDSIGKKIKVVNEIKDSLGLKNVTAEHKRVEQVNATFDFIVSRAVTRLPEFVKWTSYKFHKKSFNDVPNGIIYIKGGDVESELAELKGFKSKIYNIPDFFEESFFDTKKVVHIYR